MTDLREQIDRPRLSGKIVPSAYRVERVTIGDSEPSHRRRRGKAFGAKPHNREHGHPESVGGSCEPDGVALRRLQRRAAN